MFVGAYYAQTARLNHLFLFLVGDGGKLFDCLAENALQLLSFLVLCHEACRRLYLRVVVALLFHFLTGKKLGVAPQQNVGAAPRHVGGYGDGAQTSRLRYYGCLAAVEFGVEHVVLNTLAFEQGGKLFAFFHRDGACQHRLSLFVTLFYFLHHGSELALTGSEEQIVLVLAYHGQVGGNDHYVYVVDGVELLFFRFGGTRHAAHFAVLTEVVLQGYGGDGSVLLAHGEVFLCLYRLMQSLGKPPALHFAPRKGVYYHHFAPLDDIILVAVHYGVRPKSVVDIVV